LLDLHRALAWFVVVGNGLAGAWALGAHWVPRLRLQALWWCTGVVEIALFVQVALGVGVVAIDDIEAPEFHMFYGFLTLVTVGILYSYRGQLEEWRYLLYGGGGLFLMGLGIRAMVLG
jgi:hypothetical protein